MRKWRFVLVVLAALALSVSFAVPGEDVPETPYDESEALPYASTSVFSVPVPNAVVRTPSGRPIVAVARPDSLRRFGSQGLDHPSGSPHPISDSFIILDQSLRC